MIPTLLHQIWAGPAPLPDRERQWCSEMGRLNWPWKHTLHGNETLERYGQDPYIKAMLAKGEKWAYVSDRLRVLLLRDEGGVYLDADCQPMMALKRLSIWEREDLDFVAAMRSPHRKEVALHRGVSLIDNTFLASAKKGRMIGKIEALWTPAAVTGEGMINGNRTGIAIMEAIDDTVILLNHRYIYAEQAFPETIVLHDAHNLGSWRPQYEAKPRIV